MAHLNQQSACRSEDVEQQHQPPCHAQPSAVKRTRNHGCDSAANLQALQAEASMLRAQKHGTLLLQRRYVCMFRVLKSACEANKHEASVIFPQLVYACRQANLGPNDLAQGSAMADATALETSESDSRQQLPSQTLGCTPGKRQHPRHNPVAASPLCSCREAHGG